MIFRNGKYKVMWQTYGYTFAQPVIHERKRFLGLEYWSKVAERGDIIRQSDLAYYSEEWIANWFDEAIRRYERDLTVERVAYESPCKKYQKQRWL